MPRLQGVDAAVFGVQFPIAAQFDPSGGGSPASVSSGVASRVTMDHLPQLGPDWAAALGPVSGAVNTSALTAFLIGAEALTSNPLAAFIKAAGLLAAVLVTAFTSRLHLFNYLSKSTGYRDVKEKLVAESFAMDAGLAGYETLTSDQKLTRFEKTCEALIANLDANWTALQSPSQGSGTSG